MSAVISRHGQSFEKCLIVVATKTRIEWKLPLCFGYKEGSAPCNMVFDVRFLKNPTG